MGSSKIWWSSNDDTSNFIAVIQLSLFIDLSAFEIDGVGVPLVINWFIFDLLHLVVVIVGVSLKQFDVVWELLKLDRLIDDVFKSDIVIVGKDKMENSLLGIFCDQHHECVVRVDNCCNLYLNGGGYLKYVVNRFLCVVQSNV